MSKLTIATALIVGTIYAVWLSPALAAIRYWLCIKRDELAIQAQAVRLERKRRGA